MRAVRQHLGLTSAAAGVVLALLLLALNRDTANVVGVALAALIGAAFATSMYLTARALRRGDRR